MSTQCLGKTKQGVQCQRLCNTNYCHQHNNNVIVNNNVNIVIDQNIDLIDDVKLQILLQLNFDDLMNTCSINKSYHNMCTSTHFLKLYFKENNLLLPSILPVSFSDWCFEFEKLTIYKMYQEGLGKRSYHVPELYYIYYLLIGFTLRFLSVRNRKSLRGYIEDHVKAYYNILPGVFFSKVIDKMKKDGLLIVNQRKYILSPMFKQKVESINNWLVENNQ